MNWSRGYREQEWVCRSLPSLSVAPEVLEAAWLHRGCIDTMEELGMLLIRANATAGKSRVLWAILAANISPDSRAYWNKMPRWLLELAGQLTWQIIAMTLLRHALRPSAQSLTSWAILTETFSHGARSCALASLIAESPMSDKMIPRHLPTQADAEIAGLLCDAPPPLPLVREDRTGTEKTRRKAIFV